jgi:hypothetical protein
VGFYLGKVSFYILFMLVYFVPYPIEQVLGQVRAIIAHKFT